MALLLGAPGARGPRFIEPPEPPVPTPLIYRDEQRYLTRCTVCLLTNRGPARVQDMFM